MEHPLQKPLWDMNTKLVEQLIVNEMLDPDIEAVFLFNWERNAWGGGRYWARTSDLCHVRAAL